MGFEKIKKKYALNNSYFKNSLREHPSDPFEVLEYFIEHEELPYKVFELEEYWLYECFIEYQKRAGVKTSQFFTPPETAKKIAEIADRFGEFGDPYVLDACCGFGMLSKEILKKGFLVEGFDIDTRFNIIYNEYVESAFYTSDFRDFRTEPLNLIVSNPPYEVKELTEFLECMTNWLTGTGIAVLLLPKGFIDKERPKATVEVLSKYQVLHKEDMVETFARTNTRAEIVVLTKCRDEEI